MEGMSLCVVCSYSFPLTQRPPGEEEESTVNKFASQVDEKGESCAIFGGDKCLSICPDCLSTLGRAVGKREALDEVEVQVRHLQREILKLMRRLEGLVGEYLEEMRGIRDKIQDSDEAVLISQRKLKEGDGVWALRKGVVCLVDQLSRFEKKRFKCTVLSAPPGEVTALKLELNHEEEEEIEEKVEDERFPDVDDDDLLHTTHSPCDETEEQDGAVEMERHVSPETPPVTLSSSKSDDTKPSSSSKKRWKEKNLTITSIPLASRVFPKNHQPEWTPWKPLLHHKNNTKRRKLFVCLSCPEVQYRHPYQLEQHLREHEKSAIIITDTPPRPCPHCPLTFHYPQYWEFHVCCHEGIVRAFCDTCPRRKALNFFSLESHLKEAHQIEKVFQCPNCLYRCGKSDNYLYHVRVYHGDAIQGCYLCPATFTSPAELHQHLHQEHNALQPLTCDHEGCGKEFYYVEALKAHKNFHTDKYVCPECPRRFESAAHLKLHVEVVHQGRRWHCRHCRKQFTTSLGLKLHEESCGEAGKVAKWQCHLCEKSYRLECNLKAHLKGHVGEGYKCCDCDAQFTSRHGLKRHRKNKHPDPADGPVEPEPRIPCEICGLPVIKNNLNRHLKIHSEERKWTCEVCGKKFRERTYLRDHQRIHGTEKTFVCPECGKAYTQRAGLRHHRISAHGGGVKAAAKPTKKK